MMIKNGAYECDDDCSSSQTISGQVPQGSIPGSLLYCCY